MTVNITNTDVLKNKALMVRLTRKKFNRNKTDKDISITVSDDFKVQEAGALRVNKSIFSKDATKGFQDIYSQAGKYFYRVTLPWDDKGWRLLSIDLYKEFTKKFKSFSNDYRKFVAEFIDNIEQLVEESKVMLGAAWKASDYNFLAPNGAVDRNMLEEQFHLEIEFDTVTSGDDLRASLTEADREAIAAQIDEQAMRKFAKANDHIIVTLRDAVYSIHERLCVSEHVFRDTLISNLEELIDLIPKMNIAGDPKINEIAAEAKLKLTGWDPQDLRDDDDLRKQVSKDAEKILGNMDGII
jgi:hypothetical protein